jgi:hypothetical protein
VIDQDHHCEIESSFLRDGYTAHCSCGWKGANTYPSSVLAHAAIREHRKAVAHAAASEGERP